MKKIGLFGPGTLVTAAFIGPGTLTVCTLAGVEMGYSLLWILLFATISTIVLQEMAARVGLVTQKGLGEALRSELPAIWKGISLLLVFFAIIFGNAAYESGNISGTLLALDSVVDHSRILSVLVIGIIVFFFLWIGNYKWIQQFMIGLVLILSFVFVTTAVMVTSDLSDLLRGFIPSTFSGNEWLAIGLIGTTVVPYNLFLHASTVSKKWHQQEDMPNLRKETIFTITIGGIISMCVLITASRLMGQSVNGIQDMALQLEPLLGSWSIGFLSIGFFAAGISSSLTAPLAAALAAKGIFGLEENSISYRIVWIMVLLTGMAFSMSGYKPITIIQIAQVANGILLPVIVVFLLYVCNRTNLMGRWKNTLWHNLIGVLVLGICLLISLRSLNSVFQFLL